MCHSDLIVSWGTAVYIFYNYSYKYFISSKQGGGRQQEIEGKG